MTNQSNSKEVYDLSSVKLPYLSGFILHLFVKLLESSFSGLLLPGLFKSAGIDYLRKLILQEPPTYLPLEFTGNLARESSSVPEEEWLFSNRKLTIDDFRYSSVRDYINAYNQGSISPQVVAQRILDAIDVSNKMDPALNAIIAVNREEVLEQASQSADRIKKGKPLSIFDGIPVAVKDEVEMRGYPTSVGTAFLGISPALEDSTVVARLRAAGALLIGKTNMHEIGIGVTGLNPNTGTTRNPYNTEHFTGGSSSGSGAAVAAGLCPIAVGADAGGSIRIPASLCGTFGLKPTFGRVSENGAYPVCWSVAHLGPLAESAEDTALAYAVMAGPDLFDPNSLHQPAPTLKGWSDMDLKKVKLGVFSPWFRHADQEVVTACEAMLENFEGLGAQIIEIAIPGLEAARVAHSITIITEMYKAMSATYKEHGSQHGLDVRTNLMLAKALTANDYIQSQKVRTRFIADMRKALSEVDMILTPSTATVAPQIPRDAIPDGNSDLTTVIQLMRFATPANFSGHPAISFPVGYDHQGLPIGMQAIGRYWEEAGLLGLALVSEQFVERQKPQVYYNILKG
ncbi:MAG: amidase [Anaerolineales bacterium]